jgi:hypothetical protein
MSDTQHARPGAPTPRINLPYGNPCNENVQRAYSSSLARDLWHFRSEIPPEILPQSQVERLIAIVCAEVREEDDYAFPAPLKNLSTRLFWWRKHKMDYMDNNPPGVRNWPGQAQTTDTVFCRYLKTKLNEEKALILEELSKPALIEFLEGVNSALFHEKYEPRLPELAADITLDSQHAVAWGQIDRDMVPLLEKFYHFSVYAEPERVDRFVAALLRTLKNHSDCIRDGWKQNRTHLARQLTSVTESYGAAFGSPWKLPRQVYITDLESFVEHQAPAPQPNSPLSDARYHYIVDHARRYGRSKGRRKEVLNILCIATKPRALRHTYTARPMTRPCVIRRPMDDLPCPIRLLAGSNEILRMIACLAYPA